MLQKYTSSTLALAICSVLYGISNLSTASDVTQASSQQASLTNQDFTIKLDTIHRGYDGKTCWVHARAGVIPHPNPQEPPAVVLTMQKLLLTRSDVFYGLHDIRTDNLGKSWGVPTAQPGLDRRPQSDDSILATCDFTPQWHAASGSLLGIGQTVRYVDDHHQGGQRATTWSVYQPSTGRWSEWQTLKMPDEKKFFSAGAGSVQRYDLPDGNILLPIYFKSEKAKTYQTTVLQCRFDGEQLIYLKHGSELSLEQGRGLFEPSITYYQNRYYLTMRNDTRGYVAVSDDGLNYSHPQPWCWEDGSDLGNYNTQQHWVTHEKGLYLVYTRRGADNDHVFRHRAPLFIAKVDPEKLQVIRDTERILVPQRGARLGNFGVTKINEHETWVTVSEWMQKAGPQPAIPPDNPYGADNSVYAARIQWQNGSSQPR